ncbi:MAG: 4-alpha-glucanotransferase [Acidobacteriaceae bacterium]|nr:4-alpha-glucanotransferase [Acidobacteriaceae bacterium]MBV9779914.1 4-alpha-glucanotransferase [Acidobacteriaceae bacterium]
MNLPRSSGILLHPACLPSRFGIGDFGSEAFRFADQLASAGQTIWQMLPLGPTGYGDSPYQLFSAFAGNPLFISPELLARDGFLDHRDLESAPDFPNHIIEYDRVSDWKLPLLEKAYREFRDKAEPEAQHAFDEFCREQAAWLDDYALFIALKHAFGSAYSWTDWDDDLVRRKPSALAHWREKLRDEIQCQEFWQFEFYHQWHALRKYSHTRGLSLMGDIPIYVAHDSSDVWAHPEHFYLNESGKPAVVSGVPPDYFSATGQLWGNPIYRWPEMERSGFSWWTERFRAMFRLFDVVRLDHFRGFQAYWEVPANETTAINGRWVEGPGSALFRAVTEQLGELEIVAENLGVITPEVEAIRHEFNFPGMAILQFGFGKDPQACSFRPHNYERDLFAYTGTHDNDTVVGWWNSEGGDSTRTPEDVRKEKDFALEYLGPGGESIHWKMIRSLLSSVARAAIVPMQDVLGLGSESRMNKPATLGGNWRWRMLPGAFTSDHQARLRKLCIAYDRIPGQPGACP